MSRTKLRIATDISALTVRISICGRRHIASGHD